MHAHALTHTDTHTHTYQYIINTLGLLPTPAVRHTTHPHRLWLSACDLKQSIARIPILCVLPPWRLWTHSGQIAF